MKYLISILVLFTFLNVARAEEEWVSFGSFGQGTFLMKIDETGEILMDPVQVLPPTSIFLTTLSHPSTSRIAYYAQDLLNFPIITYRVLINENTLSMTTPKGIGIKLGFTGPSCLMATHRSSPEFLVTRVDDQNPKALEMTSNGTWDGDSWRVNPRINNLLQIQVGVSPDGEMSWGTNANDSIPVAKVFLQGLRENGRPIGDPNVAASGPFIGGADLSDPLPNGRRLFVFEPISADFSQLSYAVQQVNGTTGQKIGAPHVIANDGSSFVQNMAVDPDGAFVVYTSPDPTCGTDIMYFQALDGTGNTEGARKVLIDCSFFDISGDFPFSVDVMEAGNED